MSLLLPVNSVCMHVHWYVHIEDREVQHIRSYVFFSFSFTFSSFFSNFDNKSSMSWSFPPGLVCKDHFPSIRQHLKFLVNYVPTIVYSSVNWLKSEPFTTTRLIIELYKLYSKWINREISFKSYTSQDLTRPAQKPRTKLFKRWIALSTGWIKY